MKFCAVICEYNPFHNGHAYLLERAKEESGCDKVLCLMSGNFTQRGEIAVLNKFTRARHAIENGADIVLELPALYAVSPAELFARGAIHILSSFPAVTSLAFGCESGTREDFLAAGRALCSEDKAFKAALKEKLKEGESYIRARNAAALAFRPELEPLLSSPNNILGTEYCRALAQTGSAISPVAVLRTGETGHGELSLGKKYSSAAAVRAAMNKGELKRAKGSLPKTVYRDLKSALPTAFGEAALCALLSSPPEKIARGADCSEGLENRLLVMAKSNPVYADAVRKVTTKRYTLARVRRIIAQNFLGLERETAEKCLSEPLPAKVLAVKKDAAEEIFAALNGLSPDKEKDAADGLPAATSSRKGDAATNGANALLTRKSDYSLLKRGALDCVSRDLHADELYAALTGVFVNPHQTLFLS